MNAVFAGKRKFLPSLFTRMKEKCVERCGVGSTCRRRQSTKDCAEPAEDSTGANIGSGGDEGANMGSGGDAGAKIGSGSDAGAKIGSGGDAGAKIGSGGDAGAKIGSGGDAGAKIGSGDDAGAKIGSGDGARTGSSVPPEKSNSIDFIQQLFIDKIREYDQKKKQNDGKMFDPIPELEKEREQLQEVLMKSFFKTNVPTDLTSFPSFEYKDPPLGPIDMDIEDSSKKKK